MLATSESPLECLHPEIQRQFRGKVIALHTTPTELFCAASTCVIIFLFMRHSTFLSASLQLRCASHLGLSLKTQWHVRITASCVHHEPAQVYELTSPSDEMRHSFMAPLMSMALERPPMCVPPAHACGLRVMLLSVPHTDLWWLESSRRKTHSSHRTTCCIASEHCSAWPSIY